jgi:hypothetical protein
MVHATQTRRLTLTLFSFSWKMVQIQMSSTPLFAPGAATFLLEWPTTVVNITDRSGASFLAVVREAVAYVSNTFSDHVALPGNPDWVKDKFFLQQWREIEEMLVERGGHDTGIADLE